MKYKTETYLTLSVLVFVVGLTAFALVFPKTVSADAPCKTCGNSCDCAENLETGKPTCSENCASSPSCCSVCTGNCNCARNLAAGNYEEVCSGCNGAY